MSRFASAALVLLVSLSGCSKIRSDEARMNSVQVAAQNAVLMPMRYPKSVEFRNEVVRLAPEGPVACGEFAGMNRKREWVDFKRFIFTDKRLMTDDGEPEFAARWSQLCAQS